MRATVKVVVADVVESVQTTVPIVGPLVTFRWAWVLSSTVSAPSDQLPSAVGAPAAEIVGAELSHVVPVPINETAVVVLGAMRPGLMDNADMGYGRVSDGVTMEKDKTLPSKRAAAPDEMKVLSYREIAEHVYEVKTKSAAYGVVTRRVLVLPGSAFEASSSGGEN